MSLVSRSLTKFRQTFITDESSFPYLSGDTFKNFADFSFNNVNDFRISLPWHDIRVVFCKSDLVDYFQSEKPMSLNPKILICGNSDVDFYEFEFRKFRNLRAAFLQNSFISDNKNVYTLPIGLENAKYASNGRTAFYSRKLEVFKERKILVGPFGNTHSERNDLLDLPQHSSLHRITDRISTRNHIRNLDRYAFVACPRGNGVDTHRVWEAMYRGTIPILKENAWSKSLFDFGYPVILLNDWTDLIEGSILKFNVTPEDIRTTPFLWMNSWSGLFSRFL